MPPVEDEIVPPVGELTDEIEIDADADIETAET